MCQRCRDPYCLIFSGRTIFKPIHCDARIVIDVDRDDAEDFRPSFIPRFGMSESMGFYNQPHVKRDSGKTRASSSPCSFRLNGVGRSWTAYVQTVDPRREHSSHSPSALHPLVALIRRERVIRWDVGNFEMFEPNIEAFLRKIVICSVESRKLDEFFMIPSSFLIHDSCLLRVL